MDTLTYLAQRLRECEEVSASCDDLTVALERPDDDPPRAILVGRAHLGGDTFVHMFERIELHAEHVHRVKYGYYLFVGAEEIGGYERDPVHADSPEHFHCTHRHRGHLKGGEPAATVSFKEAATAAWEWLSDHGYDAPDLPPQI